jgi:hypothetical protein
VRAAGSVEPALGRPDQRGASVTREVDRDIHAGPKVETVTTALSRRRIKRDVDKRAQAHGLDQFDLGDGAVAASNETPICSGECRKKEAP